MNKKSPLLRGRDTFTFAVNKFRFRHAAVAPRKQITLPVIEKIVVIGNLAPIFFEINAFTTTPAPHHAPPLQIGHGSTSVYFLA